MYSMTLASLWFALLFWHNFPFFPLFMKHWLEGFWLLPFYAIILKAGVKKDFQVLSTIQRESFPHPPTYPSSHHCMHAHRHTQTWTNPLALFQFFSWSITHRNLTICDPDCFGVGGGGNIHLFMHPFFCDREWRLIYSQVKLSIWTNLQQSYSLFCARFIEIIYFNI